MPTPALPPARSSLTDSRTGAVSVEWYTFFSNMLKAAVDSGLLEAGAMDSILERLDALEGAEGGVVVGPVSVQVLGTLAGGGVTVRLRNDVAAPGETYYYGTDSTGTKGWFERRLDTLADVDVSTPPVAGDALLFDGTVWAPGAVAQEQTFNRIDAAGDIRIGADGSLRITN